MKICVLNTYDDFGGAAKACARLIQGLSRSEADVSFLVKQKVSGESPAVQVCSRFEGELCAFLDNLPQHMYPERQKNNFSLGRYGSRFATAVSARNPDIVHLHWVAGGFVQLEQLARLNLPIVWTMHDMWAFTGGCHYAGNCHSYLDQCGFCPVLGSRKARDLSRKRWQKKAQVLKDLNVTFVAPSRWLAGCCRSASASEGKSTVVIPNGIDTDLFKPMHKLAARQRLGLPVDKNIIMFGALNALTDPRKGFHLLEKALIELERSRKAEKPELVVVGDTGQTAPPVSGFKYHSLGYVSDETALAEIYSAADVFVAPSLQENLANTVMEAMSCGTPCVAFDVGGMQDLIDHQSNGYLSAPFGAEDLAGGLSWVMSSRDRLNELSSEARSKVVKTFSLQNCVDQYMDLYRDLK